MDNGICVGCDHPIGMHFESVDRKVRCLCFSSMVSSKGVIGMPWYQGCDCVDYVSEIVSRRKVQEEANREEWKRETDKLVKVIEERMKNERGPIVQRQNDGL